MCDILGNECVNNMDLNKNPPSITYEREKAIEVFPSCKDSAEPSGGVKRNVKSELNDSATYDRRSTADRGENCRKRKKPRRGKPKKKLWVRGKDLSVNEEESLQKRMRSNVFINKQPAPNNTTQFIMEDHTELQDFDVQFTAGKGTGFKTSRARDSSMSVDSEEEFYSSPEDEEEFLTKEFSNTYEDVHVERLGTMSKEELIQEYLQLEERVDFLEKKLKASTNSGTAEKCGSGGTGTDSDGEADAGELPMERAMAEKIRIFQEEINKLIFENEQLSKENERLRSSGSLVRPSSSLSSSIDSESDSSTSSGSSSSSGSGRSCKSSGSAKSCSPTFENIPEQLELKHGTLVTEDTEVLAVIEHQGEMKSRNVSGKKILGTTCTEGATAQESAILSSVLAN